MSANKPAADNSVTSSAPRSNVIWVRETRFGRWFLSTHTWYRYVLSQAISDFKVLLADHSPAQPRILDAGCGQGMAFGLLEQHFQPSSITGIDIDGEQIRKANAEAANLATPTTAVQGNASEPIFPAGSFDLILCHQLLHHSSQQQETLAEFHRLLRPGGILLVGESCRSFIQSIPVRLLFRHPAMVQKDARGYMELLREAGFHFTDNDVQTSRPWWSRRFLGMAQKLGIGRNITEPTEILIVAHKPE